MKVEKDRWTCGRKQEAEGLLSDGFCSLCTVESEIISLAKNYWGLYALLRLIITHEIGTIIILVGKKRFRGSGDLSKKAQFLSDPSEF